MISFFGRAHEPKLVVSVKFHKRQFTYYVKSEKERESGSEDEDDDNDDANNHKYDIDGDDKRTRRKNNNHPIRCIHLSVRFNAMSSACYKRFKGIYIHRHDKSEKQNKITRTPEAHSLTAIALFSSH